MSIDLTADIQTLRAQLAQIVDRASERRLRSIAAAVADTPNPPIPERLLKPSDDELARQLDERSGNSKTISSEEAYARLRNR